jgi:hypothetical protein
MSCMRDMIIKTQDGAVCMSRYDRYDYQDIRWSSMYVVCERCGYIGKAIN